MDRLTDLEICYWQQTIFFLQIFYIIVAKVFLEGVAVEKCTVLSSSHQALIQTFFG